METIKNITFAFIYSFLKAINPLASLESAITNAEKAVKEAEKAAEAAEKANDLKKYKAAIADYTGSMKTLEGLQEEKKKADVLSNNDIIQLAVLTACILKVQYTQEDLIKCGATSCGQFGYYKRSIKNLERLGFTLKADELVKAITNANNVKK